MTKSADEMKILFRLAKIVGAFAAVGWLLYFATPHIIIFIMHELPFRGEAFDREKWIAADKGNDWECLRGPMFKDLKDDYLKPGVSKRDVVALLGNPERSKVEDACLKYNLGMCSGIKADYDSLLVCFDDGQKIELVEHIQH